MIISRTNTGNHNKMAEQKNNWENIINTQETATLKKFGSAVSEEHGIYEIDLQMYKLLSLKDLTGEKREHLREIIGKFYDLFYSEQLTEAHERRIAPVIETSDWKAVFCKSVDYGQAISDMIVTPDGKYGFCKCIDLKIRQFSVVTGDLVRVLDKGHGNAPICCVTVTSNGEFAFTGSDDGTVRQWEVETGKCVNVFDGKSHWVRSLAVSSDGKRLFSGHTNGTIILWEIASGKLLCKTTEHTGTVTSLTVSYDGTCLFSGAMDRTVKKWLISQETICLMKPN